MPLRRWAFGAGHCACWGMATKMLRTWRRCPRMHPPDSCRWQAKRKRETPMTDPLTFTFTDDGAIPNSRLPLLVYRRAVPADPAAIEHLFARNHWPPAWRNG